MAGEEPAPGAASAGADQSTGPESRDDYGSPVWALASATTGGLVGSATIGGELWIKDLSTSGSFRLGYGPMGWARSLAISPDGGVLAVAGLGPSFQLWDLAEGRPRAALELDGMVTKTVAFPVAGPLLAVGGRREQGRSPVVLWDWRERRRLRVLDGHAGAVNHLAFSADGAILASGEASGVVKLWETAGGRDLASWGASRPGDVLKALALSPDGNILATAGLSDAGVRLWDAPSGHPRGFLPATGGPVNGLAFSPDGRLLALARQDGTAVLCEVETAREVGAIRARSGPLEAVIFAEAGRMLATGGSDGSLRLWDVSRVLGEREPTGVGGSALARSPAGSGFSGHRAGVPIRGEDLRGSALQVLVGHGLERPSSKTRASLGSDGL
jgi:WD40 repeat protein